MVSSIRNTAILAFAAASIAAARVSTLVARAELINLQAAIGSASCPVPTAGDTVNANVLAVVSFNELVSVTALGGLATTPVANPGPGGGFIPVIGGIAQAPVNVIGGIAPIADVQATVALDICLCLDASLQLTEANLANVRAQALADLVAQAEANVAANPTLLLLDTILDAGALASVSLTPVRTNLCDDCAANEIPTCVDGACVCVPCGTGLVYSPAAGVCVAAPAGASQISSANRNKRHLPGNATSEQLKSRQAKRGDIAHRMAVRGVRK